jgi:PleD family two-component response regulator
MAAAAAGSSKRDSTIKSNITHTSLLESLPVIGDSDKTRNLNEKSILLIDDSPSVLRVTSRFLHMNGHSVVTALNGSSGIYIYIYIHVYIYVYKYIYTYTYINIHKYI